MRQWEGSFGTDCAVFRRRRGELREAWESGGALCHGSSGDFRDFPNGYAGFCERSWRICTAEEVQYLLRQCSEPPAPSKERRPSRRRTTAPRSGQSCRKGRDELRASFGNPDPRLQKQWSGNMGRRASPAPISTVPREPPCSRSQGSPPRESTPATSPSPAPGAQPREEYAERSPQHRITDSHNPYTKSVLLLFS
jgi:hypothetical protein